MLIQLRSHSGEWLNNLCDSNSGLFVLLHEVSVRIDLKLRLFTVRCNQHFVVPLAIGIVFPHYLNDVSAGGLFLDCLLDCCRQRLDVDLFSRMFSRFSGPAQSKPDADCYRQNCVCRFHSFSRYGLTKGTSKILELHCCNRMMTALS